MTDPSLANEPEPPGASGSGWTPRTRIAAIAVATVAVVAAGAVVHRVYDAATMVRRRFATEATVLLEAIERSDPPAAIVRLSREEIGVALPADAVREPLDAATLDALRRSVEARLGLVCCEVIDPGESVLLLVPFEDGEPVRYAFQFITHDGRLTIGKDTVDFLGDVPAREERGGTSSG